VTVGICGLIGLAALFAPATFARRHNHGHHRRRSMRVGQAPQRPRGTRVIGSLGRSTRLHVTVVLQPRDPAALARYATDVATPGSGRFHRYLTVNQFASRFGPTPSQLAAVESELRAHGLHPGTPTANHLSIPLSATAASVAQAFSTKLERVELPGGRRAFANTAAPLFSAGVAPFVQNVVGLDNLVLAQPLGLARPNPRDVRRALRANVVTGGPQPCAAASGYATAHGQFTADQLASAYQLSSEYMAGDAGAGQTIGIYELEPNSTSDISAYQACYGTSASVTYRPASDFNQTGAGSGEAALDIEDVIGLAPKANIIVYQGVNGTSDELTLYEQMVSDDTAKVISTSWGLCELGITAANAASENTVFQEAAVQGQSVFAASGDFGSEACGGSNTALSANDPAAQPYVTGVGGTTLSTLGPPPTQSVWDDSTASHECGGGTPCGGGGGISRFWGMPTYQTGAPAFLNVINSNSSGTPCTASSGHYCREVPDVSADADPYTGYVIYFGGAWAGIGGTSAAAPTWAAFAALVNASSGCGGSPVGWINPVLYNAAANSYGTDFSDITSGNNDVKNAHGGLYPAGLGFDMASGLGTPIGSALPATLCSAGTIKSLGTVALPDAGALPTGVVVDTANHIAYVTENKDNAVASIANTSATSFSGTAANVPASALPGLNYPDELALDASGNVFAADFCDGSQASACSGEAAGTATAVSQQTGASSGQKDGLPGCGYPSGTGFSAAAAQTRLFVACAGTGVVADCSPGGGGTPACGSADATIALNTPAGGLAPVPSGVATIPATTTPSVVVADAANDTVSVVSWTANGLTAGTPFALAAGCEPANVAIGPSSDGIATVYVACPGIGVVEAGTIGTGSSPAFRSFVATALPHLGSNTPRPYGIAVNAGGTSLVVTDAANNDAVVYPFLSGTSLGSGTVVAVGSTPDGVGMDGGNAFIANEGSDNVSVIDPPPATPGARARYRFASRRSELRAAAGRPVTFAPLVAPLPSTAR
jgi:hypothetical protein